MDGQIKKLIDEAEKIKNEMAERRDRLREIISDLESLADSADRGIESMEAALDAFSELM